MYKYISIDTYLGLGVLSGNILSKREVKEGRSFSHLNGKEVAFDGSEWLLRG